MLGRLSIILAQEGLESDEMEALLDVHADEFDKHLIYSLRNGSNCTVEDMFTDCECHFFIICYIVSTYEFINHTHKLYICHSELGDS